MELKQLTQRALEIQHAYRQLNHQQQDQPWSSAEYLQGLIGDIGDLTKLIMAKNNFRHIDDTNSKLAHELSDCLWSILILAHELNIDLEQSFLNTMDQLQSGINRQIEET